MKWKRIRIEIQIIQTSEHDTQIGQEILKTTFDKLENGVII